MNFLTHLFGTKPAPSEAAGLAQLQELCHKVEQAFPESIRVAMRLIEKRPPEIDAVADAGEPGHEVFARLALKAINLKRQHTRPDARQFTFEELPALERFMAGETADREQLVAGISQGEAELIQVMASSGGDEWSNVLLTLEAQLEFVADANTVLVVPGGADFLVRRDFLRQAITDLGPALKFDSFPDALTHYARKQAEITEDSETLTAFGYPLTRFYFKGDLPLDLK